MNHSLLSTIVRSASLAVTALCLSPAAVQAQTITKIGEMHATIDGEASTWDFIKGQQGGETGATAHLHVTAIGPVNLYNLSLQGRAADSTPVAKGNLSVELSYTAGKPSPGTPPSEASISLFPTGLKPPFWLSAGEGIESPTIQLTVFEQKGDIARVEGTFSGTVCHQKSIRSDDIDTDNCKKIEGRFATDVLVD